MDKIASFARALMADESGVTAIEYGLIGTLVVVGAIAGFTAFGDELSKLYADWIAEALKAIRS